MKDSITGLTAGQKAKAVLALAVPTVIENFLLTIVGFADTFFVAKIGLPEVAAVGVTNAIAAIYIAVFLALGIGTAALIAQSIGAGDKEKARVIAGQSVWLASGAGAAAGLITLFFAEPLLCLMGVEPEVLSAGTTYFQITGIPAIFIALMAVFGTILRSAGDSKTPMKVGFWVNILHLVLDYFLIFGIGSWQGWGIAGAAWATTLSRVAGTIALYLYIQQSQVAFSLRQGVARKFMLPLLTLAGPAVVERLVMRLGQLFYAGLIVRIGTDAYTSFIIAGNISYFSFMPGYGLAVAATTLVGNQIGRGCKREAYQYGIITACLAVAFMGLIGVVYFCCAAFAGTWFTQEPQVIDMVATGLKIDAFAQPFIAISLVMAGALQGAGDTKSPMYSTILGIWGIRVIGIYLLCLHFTMGIAGVWLVNGIDYALRSAFLLHRFKKYNDSEVPLAEPLSSSRS